MNALVVFVVISQKLIRVMRLVGCPFSIFWLSKVVLGWQRQPATRPYWVDWLIISMILRNLFRKFYILNKLENLDLSKEFELRKEQIKEKKSKALFDKHYVLLAQDYFLKKDNLLLSPSNKEVHNYAMNLFFDDLHNHKLDEFYNFVGSKE